ncbi:hypothetical protein XA68_15971 [Ophiocordyceps unilateralis]|uniref:Uncharacterized protein n=1 Tax=Ophiocordyceps unilateralis TaxID=268505 RepID=A0A2A9P795_OPHUN|nr:hypothetical protein XA68_15971 [Ophiocordyceps unilateralis]
MAKKKKNCSAIVGLIYRVAQFIFEARKTDEHGPANGDHPSLAKQSFVTSGSKFSSTAVIITRSSSHQVLLKVKANSDYCHLLERWLAPINSSATTYVKKANSPPPCCKPIYSQTPDGAWGQLPHGEADSATTGGQTHRERTARTAANSSTDVTPARPSASSLVLKYECSDLNLSK